MKNLNKFSNDPSNENILDITRKKIRTILVNDKIRFPDFEVVTGISRNYLEMIMVEEKAVKYDSGMIVEFFNRGNYKKIYEKECNKYHHEMRQCFSYFKSKKYENLEVFSEFDTEISFEEVPNVATIVPIIGYFGKFMFRESDIKKYEFTPLERIVIGQVLSANASDLKKMNLYPEEIAAIKDNFVMYIPALFIRHCPSILPVMILPEILEKIEQVKQNEKVEREREEVNRKQEEERMVFLDNNVEIRDIEVTYGDTYDNDLLSGRIVSEESTQINIFTMNEIVVKSKKDMFKYDFSGSYIITLNADVFQEMFGDYDVKSRIVLSRVCKEWYECIRNVKRKRKDTISSLPSAVKDEWMEYIIDVLRNKGFYLQLNPFLYFILKCVKAKTVDYSDLIDFYYTYGTEVMTTGTVLLLSIFYIQSRRFYNPYVVLSKELENIYLKLDDCTRSIIRRGIKCGSVKCTGNSFRIKRRYISFDNMEYIPIGSKDTLIWTGFENVPLIVNMYDRNEFQKKMRDLLKKIRKRDYLM